MWNGWDHKNLKDINSKRMGWRVWEKKEVERVLFERERREKRNEKPGGKSDVRQRYTYVNCDFGNNLD